MNPFQSKVQTSSSLNFQFPLEIDSPTESMAEEPQVSTEASPLMGIENQISALKAMAQAQGGRGARGATLEKIHAFLDVGGLIPGIGEPFDLVNGGLYLAEGKPFEAALCGAAMIPLGGVFAAGGRLAKTVDTEKLTREAVAEVLGQTTLQGGKIADGIRKGAVKMNLLGKELYEKTLKKFGIDPKVESVQALAYKDQIYVQRDNAEVFRDIVHEGTHALDYLDDYQGSVYQWERRAFYFEQQFQKWVDRPLEFEDMNDMMKAIYELY